MSITNPLTLMLEDQEFAQAIKVIIGPELFHTSNPLMMNVANAQQFQRVICPSGMFKFYYLAFFSSDKYGDQKKYADDLQTYGIAMSPVLIEKPIDDDGKKMISDLAHASDITYPTEVIKAAGIRGRQEYMNGVTRFIEALTTQVQTTAGWEWELFSEF